MNKVLLVNGTIMVIIVVINLITQHFPSQLPSMLLSALKRSSEIEDLTKITGDSKTHKVRLALVESPFLVPTVDVQFLLNV